MAALLLRTCLASFSHSPPPAVGWSNQKFCFNPGALDSGHLVMVRWRWSRCRRPRPEVASERYCGCDAQVRPLAGACEVVAPGPQDAPTGWLWMRHIVAQH